jgi:hypothetical protein
MRILFLLLLLPITALAQDYDLQSAPKVRVEGDETEASAPEPVKSKVVPSYGISKPALDAAAAARARKKEQKDPLKDPVTWAGQVGYAIRTDLADQIKPRLYQHSLSLSYGMEYAPSRVSLTGVLSAGYESAGEQNSEILVNENDSELFVNDFSLALQKSVSGPWKSNFSFTLGNEFPTSAEAKREGYGSVTSLDAGWSLPIVPKKFSLSVGTGVHYIWNSYEYSPATGDLNPQGGWTGALGVSWTIWKGWSVSGSAGSRLTRYLDGTSDVTYRNSIGTGYNFGRFAVTLSTSNGTYLDKEDAYIWFLDEYRRTLSLSTRFTF